MIGRGAVPAEPREGRRIVPTRGALVTLLALFLAPVAHTTVGQQPDVPRMAMPVYGNVDSQLSDLVQQAVRGGIEQALAAARGEDVAILDFSSVRLLDLSCADEVVAKVLLEHGQARHFLLRGVSEDHQDALEPVPTPAPKSTSRTADPAGPLRETTGPPRRD